MTHHQQTLELMLRRERLLAQCDAQRGELEDLVAQWQSPLQIADRVLAGIRYLRGHPVILAAAVALAVVIQRRGLWGWVQRGFMLWRAYRAFGKSGSRFGT